jgi:hypothetical protein
LNDILRRAKKVFEMLFVTPNVTSGCHFDRENRLRENLVSGRIACFVRPEADEIDLFSAGPKDPTGLAL